MGKHLHLMAGGGKLFAAVFDQFLALFKQRQALFKGDVALLQLINHNLQPGKLGFEVFFFQLWP